MQKDLIIFLECIWVLALFEIVGKARCVLLIFLEAIFEGPEPLLRIICKSHFDKPFVTISVVVEVSFVYSEEVPVVAVAILLF